MIRFTLLLLFPVGGHRKIVMDHNFFTGYRKTALNPGEVVISIMIPFTKKREYFQAYKQAHRRDDDIAIVNGAFRVVFDDTEPTIREMAMSFGGMAPTTVMAQKTMAAVRGRSGIRHKA